MTRPPIIEKAEVDKAMYQSAVTGNY